MFGKRSGKQVLRSGLRSIYMVNKAARCSYFTRRDWLKAAMGIAG